MKYVIWIAIVLLLVLHQDFWLWEDTRLIGGFLPIGMAYHIGVSLVAAVLWILAAQFCWPRIPEFPPDIEEGEAGA